MTEDHPQEYAYLRLPPHEEVRSCVGLVLAGMAARARVGVGGLEEAVEVLEGFHSDDAPTRFRFSLAGDGVLAEDVWGRVCRELDFPVYIEAVHRLYQADGGDLDQIVQGLPAARELAG